MHNDGDSKDVYGVRPTGELVAQVRILAETRDVEGYCDRTWTARRAATISILVNWR